MSSKKLVIACTAALGLALAVPVHALQTNTKGLSVDGRVKIGATVLTDLKDNGNEAGPSNYIAEIKAAYRPQPKRHPDC